MVFADPELGRADEVPDVLDHEEVELLERKRGQRRPHHVRVEVALAAEAGVGVDLDDRHMEVRDPVGVERGLHVALEDADAHAVEPAQRPLEQRRLSGARERSSG